MFTVAGCGSKHIRFLHQLHNPVRDRGVVRRVDAEAVANANSTVDQHQVHNTYTDTVACSHTGAGKNGGRVILLVIPIRVHVFG